MSTTDINWTEYTEAEKQAYQTTKYKMFKMTIAICIIYGVIALLFLLLGMYTQWGQQVLFGNLFPFMFTFILGTIIIIIYLANEIYKFKPSKTKIQIPYDSDLCPDYWKINFNENPENWDDEKHSYLSKDLNKYQFQYKCSADNTVLNKNEMVAQDQKKPVSQRRNFANGTENNFYVKLNNNNFNSLTGLNKPDDVTKFKQVSANMAGYNTENNILSKNNKKSLNPISGDVFTIDSVPLQCDSVYPVYLSALDEQNVALNPSEPNNKYRCAFANACGITWTEAGCV